MIPSTSLGSFNAGATGATGSASASRPAATAAPARPATPSVARSPMSATEVGAARFDASGRIRPRGSLLDILA